MRIVGWVARGLLFVLLLGFALKNTDPVTVRYYFGVAWQAPLVVVLLVIFVLGAAGGILATLGYVLRQRREIGRLKRQTGLADVEVPSAESGT
jgi:putative membrane protein